MLWPDVAEKSLFSSKVDWRDRWMRTPLHWAIVNQEEAAAVVLLAAGADLEAKVSDYKHKKGSHLVNESPRELAERVFVQLQGEGGDGNGAREHLDRLIKAANILKTQGILRTEIIDGKEVVVV